MRAGELVVLSGRHKSFKSTHVLQMGRDGAAGQAFLGRFTVPKPVLVLIVQEEIHPTFYALRVQEMVADLDRHSRSRMLVLNRRGVRLEKDTAPWDGLIALIGERRPQILILDNVSAMFPPGIRENDYQEVYTRVIAPLLELRDKYDLGIIAVAHDRKPVGDSGRSVRGTSAWENAADTLIVIHRSEALATIKVEARNGGGAEDYAVRFNPETGQLELAELPPRITTPERASTINAMLASGGSISAPDLAKALNIARNAALLRLQALVGEGHVTVDASQRPHVFSLKEEAREATE